MLQWQFPKGRGITNEKRTKNTTNKREIYLRYVKCLAGVLCVADGGSAESPSAAGRGGARGGHFGTFLSQVKDAASKVHTTCARLATVTVMLTRHVSTPIPLTLSATYIPHAHIPHAHIPHAHIPHTYIPHAHAPTCTHTHMHTYVAIMRPHAHAPNACESLSACVVLACLPQQDRRRKEVSSRRL